MDEGEGNVEMAWKHSYLMLEACELTKIANHVSLVASRKVVDDLPCTTHKVFHTRTYHFTPTNGDEARAIAMMHAQNKLMLREYFGS